MTASPVRSLVSTSFQLIGLTTNMAAIRNQSDYSPTDTINWSVPEGCTVVSFSKMDFSPWNHPDSVVSVEERLFVQRVRQYIQLLFFLIGGPTNVINMVVFCKQGLKDRVTLCLCFLSLNDGLFLIVQTVFQAEELYNLFLSRPGIGPYLTFIINNKLLIIIGLYYASPVLSAMIAVERCLCVFNPLKFRSLVRTRTVAVAIFLVYVSVYALSFVLYLRFRIGCLYDPVFNIRVMSAIEDEFFKANKDLVDIMESIVLGIGVFGGTMVVVMIATVLTIMKLRHIVEWRSEVSSSFSSREVGLTKMLVGSSVLFIICLTPFTVFHVVRLFFPEVDYGKRDHNLYLCCIWMGEALILIKPSSNIFVYYVMGSRYRETFWAMFGRKGKHSMSQK